LLKPEEVLALPERTAITFTPGVLPIWTTLIRSYEEPRLGRGFGLLAGFKTWLGVFMGSLVVLAGAGCLALVVSQNVKGISLGKQMPVRHEPEFFLPNQR
jgi:type IV secretion system protein VirD4